MFLANVVLRTACILGSICAANAQAPLSICEVFARPDWTSQKVWVRGQHEASQEYSIVRGTLCARSPDLALNLILDTSVKEDVLQLRKVIASVREKQKLIRQTGIDTKLSIECYGAVSVTNQRPLPERELQLKMSACRLPVLIPRNVSRPQRIYVLVNGSWLNTTIDLLRERYGVDLSRY